MAVDEKAVLFFSSDRQGNARTCASKNQNPTTTTCTLLTITCAAAKMSSMVAELKRENPSSLIEWAGTG
jgi:hypothetical protein